VSFLILINWNFPRRLSGCKGGKSEEGEKPRIF
jgi:hypothetical protein